MKKLLPYLGAGCALLAGVFIGRVFSKPDCPEKTPEPVRSSSPDLSRYNLINPFLDCIEARKLDMRELDIFKPRILQYIERTKQRHPDVHISYYFRDLNNGLWIGVNEKEVFSPASLMKVPIMITLLKEAQKNPAILYERIRFDKKRFEQVDEDSGFEKQDGSEYTVDEYLRQMIVYSDNAATIILLDRIGIDKVTKVQDDLNLQSNGITDPDANFVPINRYSSVFRVLFNASYLDKDMSQKALKLLTETIYSKGIREAIPERYLVAQKYGERDFFDEKGNRNTRQLHHFGIVFYTGKPFLLGIMTRGANKEVKEKIIYDLARITYEEIDRQMK